MDSKKAGIATALVMAILSAGYIASIFIKKSRSRLINGSANDVFMVIGGGIYATI